MLFSILYLIISIFNFFLGIFLRLIFKTSGITSAISLKDNRGQLTIRDIRHNNNFIDKLSVVFNRSFFPSISVNYLEYRFKNLCSSSKSDVKFKLWRNDTKLINSFNNFNKLCNDLLVFNLFIRSLRIYYSNDLRIDMFGLNVFKLSKSEQYIRLKIKNIKIYYLDSFVGRVCNLKITFRPGKTIYCDEISILFNRVLLNNNFLDVIGKLYNFVNSDECDNIPKIMIKTIKANIYLHNYIAIKLNNFIFEESLLHLAKIKIKIWKKDSIWVDNFKINILDTYRKPIIENIRIRLFDSTSDKLYKTLIILRKKFISVTKKPIKYIYPKKEFIINHNYIKTLNNPPATPSNVTVNMIIDEYLAIINNFAINYKLLILNLVIKLSYEDGEIYAENLEYTINEEYNILSINSWKFYNKDTIFIKKHIDDSSEFYIKFNKTTTHIVPYKMYIYFDLVYFENMCRILKKTIERLNNLFYSSYYIYNKGYVYEHFYIDSFMGVLNYKKTNKNLKSLLEGNSIELLNYIDVSDLNILLGEVILSYPKDWGYIIHKIGGVYKKSIYNSNFKSIVTKISGERTASVLFLKDNLKYLKKKFVNSLKKQS